jgi:hypothetical protein
MYGRFTVLAAVLWAAAARGQTNGEWTVNRIPGTNLVWTAQRTSNEVWAARAVATGAVATAQSAYASATGAAAVASDAYATATGAVATAGAALAQATNAAAVAAAAYAAGTNGAALGAWGYAAATNAQASAAAATNTAAQAAAAAAGAAAVAASATNTSAAAYAAATNAQATARAATNTAWSAYAAATNAQATAAAATNTAAQAEGAADNAELLASIALSLAESYYAPSTNAQALAYAAAATANTASSNALLVYAVATNAGANAAAALNVASYPTNIWGGLGGVMPGDQSLTAWHWLDFADTGVPRVHNVAWSTNTWWATWKTAYPTNALGDDLAVYLYNNGVAQTVPAATGLPAGPYLPYPSDGADQWEWEVSFYSPYPDIKTNVLRLTTLTNVSGVAVYLGITNRYAGYLYSTNMTEEAFTNASEFWLSPLQAGVTQAMRFAWNRTAPATSSWDVASAASVNTAQSGVNDLNYWVENDFPVALASLNALTNGGAAVNGAALTNGTSLTIASGSVESNTNSYTPAGAFLYTTNNGYITITGYTGAGGDVRIPPYINGWQVGFIGTNAFARKTLASATVPFGVYNVGSNAFYQCTATNIYLGDSITNIGGLAFLQCPNLRTINMPLALKTLGYAVFYETRITSPIILPEGVRSISDRCFNRTYTGGSGLTSVKFPSTLTSVGSYAFSESGLTSVTIPAACATFGDRSFSISPLTNVVFEGRAPIGWDSFFNCPANLVLRAKPAMGFPNYFHSRLVKFGVRLRLDFAPVNLDAVYPASPSGYDVLPSTMRNFCDFRLKFLRFDNYDTSPHFAYITASTKATRDTLAGGSWAAFLDVNATISAAAVTSLNWYENAIGADFSIIDSIDPNLMAWLASPVYGAIRVYPDVTNVNFPWMAPGLMEATGVWAALLDNGYQNLQDKIVLDKTGGPVAGLVESNPRWIRPTVVWEIVE